MNPSSARLAGPGDEPAQRPSQDGGAPGADDAGHPDGPLLPPAATDVPWRAAPTSGRRRRTRRWTLALFAVEVVIVIALVWFSWSGGPWG